eukprot:COSAG02_NODE_23285_length_723_cov_1.544872_1_plen_82_part_00
MAMYGSANYDYRFAPPGYDERFYSDYRTSFNYAHAQTVQAPVVTAAADSPPSEVRIFLAGMLGQNASFFVSFRAGVSRAVA